MSFSTQDILQQLAEIPPNTDLAQARTVRDAATRHTQGSHEALFSASADGNLTPTLRFLLAEKISGWHQDSVLQRFYAGRLTDFPVPADSDALQLALAHAERLTLRPATANHEHLHALLQAGWTTDDIVTLSQLTAFVSFQSRLLRGFRLLAGQPVAETDTVVAAAGTWHTQPLTHNGKPAPLAFTQEELAWEPWIPAKPLAEFSAAEQAVLEKFGHTHSDYFRLLGRNQPVLEQRTLTDKGIFYTSGGLPRAERELAAAVASKVNGCIYCASVHARKASQLAKRHDAVQHLLAVAPGGDLGAEQEPRWQAIIDVAARLSVTPAQLNPQDIERLRQQGLSTLEILDLIQSAAFFAWANRLMLTLGEPFQPQG
ncbi:alkylhydroperoxidase domain protein [Musicola keenii]|uniref:alkylhydroperoxidase domain protein n=1 Tax=Musicola keenii TaxID=2884250 RepID=UPI001785AD4E|nr:alkylhydroperoxidase domain protein [Musicola keenii]